MPIANPNRKKILGDIFEYFSAMTSWITTSPHNYLKNYTKAEALIELLEVDDCGSVGGYDDENPVIEGESGLPLYNRFLALLRKKNTALPSCLGFTPKTLGDYWTRIDKQRSKPK